MPTTFLLIIYEINDINNLNDFCKTFITELNKIANSPQEVKPNSSEGYKRQIIDLLSKIYSEGVVICLIGGRYSGQQTKKEIYEQLNKFSFENFVCDIVTKLNDREIKCKGVFSLANDLALKQKYPMFPININPYLEKDWKEYLDVHSYNITQKVVGSIPHHIVKPHIVDSLILLERLLKKIAPKKKKLLAKLYNTFLNEFIIGIINHRFKRKLVKFLKLYFDAIEKEDYFWFLALVALSEDGLKPSSLRVILDRMQINSRHDLSEFFETIEPLIFQHNDKEDKVYEVVQPLRNSMIVHYNHYKKETFPKTYELHFNIAKLAHLYAAERPAERHMLYIQCVRHLLRAVYSEFDVSRSEVLKKGNLEDVNTHFNNPYENWMPHHFVRAAWIIYFDGLDGQQAQNSFNVI